MRSGATWAARICVPPRSIARTGWAAPASTGAILAARDVNGRPSWAADQMRACRRGLTRVMFDQAPILNILVPQTGQVPSVAGLPFFMVILWSFCIVRLALHFTQ